MEVRQIDPRDETAFDAWFSVLHATDLERWPDGTGWQRTERLGLALDTEGPEEHRCLSASDDDGRVVGIADLEMFRRENLQLARLDIRVLPAARRKGVGTAILAEAVRIAAGVGRTELGGMDETPVGTGPHGAAEGFARHHGFVPALFMAKRELALPLTAAALQQLQQSPVARPAGYELSTFRDRWPDADMDDRCELGRRMSTDVPMGDQQLDEELWDAARVRQIERLVASQGRSKVTAVARHLGSGRLVAFTEVVVSTQAPEAAWQHDTLVMREHRGHGLGFALKLANLEALTAAFPEVQSVRTWNATDNLHMISINEAVGFELAATSVYWLKPIAGTLVSDQA